MEPTVCLNPTGFKGIQHFKFDAIRCQDRDGYRGREVRSIIIRIQNKSINRDRIFVSANIDYRIRKQNRLRLVTVNQIVTQFARVGVTLSNLAFQVELLDPIAFLFFKQGNFLQLCLAFPVAVDQNTNLRGFNCRESELNRTAFSKGKYGLIYKFYPFAIHISLNSKFFNVTVTVAISVIGNDLNTA